MKHLLIILISILLLSSPVIGDNHKGETLYRWETSSGYQWMIFGDKDTHPVYKGDVENGKPNGQGTHTTPEGHKYEGEWKDGVKNGQGTSTFPNGLKYVGEWKNGERHGQGTFTHPNGYKYIGDWNKGYFGTGTWYDIKGNILKKYVNGKVTYTVGE